MTDEQKCNNCGEIIDESRLDSTLWVHKVSRRDTCQDGTGVAEPTPPTETQQSYDNCSKADADAAEQFAVVYVAQVGVSKESMVDAISTIRAQLLTAWRERDSLGRRAQAAEHQLSVAAPTERVETSRVEFSITFEVTATVDHPDYLVQVLQELSAVQYVTAVRQAAVAPSPAGESQDGISLIQAERRRQVESEKWTFAHDDEHANAEMVRAAMAYSDVAVTAYWGNDVTRTHANGMWPWDKQWWKPSPDPIRNLVKAGALIAAEIDRLRRKAAKP